MSIRTIPGYYISNNTLFKEGEDEKYQIEAHKAKEIAVSLIKSDDDVEAHFKTWSTSTYTVVDATLNPLSDPWFWLTINFMSQHSIGSFSGNSDCGGCSGDFGGGGEGCAIILLIGAIVLLVASIFAVLGLTINEGLEADKVRETINLVEKEKSQAENEDVKAALEKMIPLLKTEYRDKSLKTFFTAVVAAGLGLLTAAGVLALLAYLNKTPFSPLMKVFEIAGGATAGAGILAQIIRYIASEARKDLNKFTAIFNDIDRLNSLMIHPNQALKETTEAEEKAYVVFNDQLFIKNGKDSFSQIKNPSAQKVKNLQETGYTRLTFTSGK